MLFHGPEVPHEHALRGALRLLDAKGPALKGRRAARAVKFRIPPRRFFEVARLYGLGVRVTKAGSTSVYHLARLPSMGPAVRRGRA